MENSEENMQVDVGTLSKLHKTPLETTVWEVKGLAVKPNMLPQVCVWEEEGWGGGGQGLNLVLPLPLNPGPHPIFVGSCLFVFFSIAKYIYLIRRFSV